jgi:DNA-binding NarL/FixJ family response regulator
VFPEDVGEGTKTDIYLALRNSVARLGVETMLREVGLVGGFHAHGGCADAVDALMRRPLAAPTVLIAALDEIDEPAQYALGLASKYGAKVLILVGELDTGRLGRLSRVPSSGFLATGELSPDALRGALRGVHESEMPMPPGFVQALLAAAHEGSALAADVQTGFRITAREKQVLSLLVEGLSNKQIARELKISEHGAKRHVANILAKLNSPNRTVAVAKALRYQLHIPQEGPT